MNCLDDWKSLHLKNQSLFFERWGASAINHNDNIILFGGYSQDFYLNQLLVLNIEKLELKEIKYENGPRERSNFSCAKYLKEDGEPFLIIHGGINHNGELNDTFELNLKSYAWKEIKTQGEIPPCSTEHSAEIYNDLMIVLGGELNEDLHDIVRILNLKTRTWKSFLPSNGFDKNMFMRIFHGSAIVDSKLFIYSGADTAYFCYNDMVEIDFKNFDFDKNSNLDDIEVIHYDDFKYGNSKHKHKANEKAKHSMIDFNSRFPYPRWGANMLAKNSNCLILFGGRNKKDFNDLWLYSITMKKWFEIHSFGLKTDPRRKAASVLINNVLFVFGGFQDLFLKDISVIYLNHLDFYKSYTAKNLLQITRPPIGESINFVLSKQKVSFNKSFFLKKIQMENEKITVPNMLNNDNNKDDKLTEINDNNANSQYLKINPEINYIKSDSHYQILDVSRNKHFSMRSLMLFYEIGFIGKLISYVNVKDLEDLIEIAKFFNQTTIKIKLTNILTGILTLYSQEHNNIDVKSEVFNLGLYCLKESRNYFSTNFYNLKNKFCPERDYLQIHSKLLLKFLDSSYSSSDLFQIVPGNMFKYLLNYIYNCTFSQILNGEINIYLELLFYAKFFKIKSLFKEIQYKIKRYLSLEILPLVALFAVKLKADVLLYLIAFEILFKNNLTNWKDYFYDHLINFTNNFYINNTINSILKVLHENEFYFCLLKNSESNNSNRFPDIKEKSFIDLTKFNDFVLENILDKSLRSVPKSFLDAYSGKDINKNKDKYLLGSFERINIENSYENRTIRSLDL